MKRDYIFNLKLKEILERKGITQRELAERTKLREATISEMVNNARQVINKRHLAVIMDALNITDINDIIELIVVEKEK